MLQVVGADDDGVALLFQTFDDLKELRRGLGVERGGRLVHKDDLRLLHDGLGDLNHLHIAGGEGLDLLPRVDTDAHIAEEFRGLPNAVAVGDQRAADRFCVQKYIFCDHHVADQTVVLVDHGDGLFTFPDRNGLINVLAKKSDGTCRLGIDAVDNLHQRALARAVFADKAHDLSLPQGKINAVQRADAGEFHHDAMHFDRVDSGLCFGHLRYLISGRCAIQRNGIEKRRAGKHRPALVISRSERPERQREPRYRGRYGSPRADSRG